MTFTINFRTFLAGYKTYLTAAAALIAAATGYADGSITAPEAVTAVFAALGTAFVRAGVKAEIDRLIAGLVLPAGEFAAAAVSGLAEVPAQDPAK